MKKFKDLNYTLTRLNNEVELLTKKTIELNADYNLLNYKIKDKQEQYDELHKQLIEEAHNNKVDIRNFNKTYEEILGEKDKELKELNYTLSLKETELKKLNTELQHYQIELQKLDKILKASEKAQEVKGKILIKIQEELTLKKEELIDKEIEWDNKLREKTKQYKTLEKKIKSVRDEAIVTKQLYDVRIEEIDKQKMVLDLYEKRLKEKEEKYKSDMKELLSAKQLQNG